MALITRIGRCENCQRTMKLRTRNLCRSCWNHRDQPGYQPWAPHNRTKDPDGVAVAAKLWDDWWHFQAFLGRYWAVQHLAGAYGCGVSTIENWVRIHDPGPIEEPVAA